MALRHNRVYLPVHQTLSRQQLLACGKNLLHSAAQHWQAKVLSRDEWETYWIRCQHTNLLQSWQYGDAKEQAEGWQAQRFLIVDENKQAIALAQVLTRVLPLVGGIARLNRGPLLLFNHPMVTEVPRKLAALQVLLKEAHRRRWWLLQAAPELPDTTSAALGLQALGFRKLTAPAWASARMSLQIEEQGLLMQLNGKWRNCMRKGVKLGVTVSRNECKDEVLTFLMRSYIGLQSSRGFLGLSEKLIRALAAQQGPQWQFNLFIARDITTTEHGEPLGILVTVRSGDTALYFIGSTNDKGRQMQANSVLLWQALLHAKQSACNWFDVGGLSEATPKGIAEFKKGINAAPYKCVGEWRRWA
jgi:lipid II:glycine glycyltransferase (peptidoglycan interpeptide bridge formation enzyme)